MKILLDTNIWRYIVDDGAIGVVQRAVRRSRHEIVIAPSVVYEALRTGDRELRKSLISAMTLPYWKRLMPEAYQESQEIKSEIERLHPEWLHWDKDLTYHERLRHDWTRFRGGFWDRARHDTHRESERIDTQGLVEKSRASTRGARERALTMLPRWKGAPFNSLQASLCQPTPGWNGEPVEWWRVEARETFGRALTATSHPYAEWLDGEVNLTMMVQQTGDLTRFWLHEVDVQGMRRHWLRSAFEFQQQFHKITDGTPCDSQFGTYLVDADLMLSADKNLVRFAERCRREAPFMIARSILIPGGRSAVEAFLAELSHPDKLGPDSSHATGRSNQSASTVAT
ncbi:hypothetical protein BGLT_01302 [Caballeronia glathei]|nr:hypothetical protein [Caballeronia glathei]CDY78429.1 hypothetical protein BGLT_01302 [Caballeronia glathei]